jgi:hypothetical protein
MGWYHGYGDRPPGLFRRSGRIACKGREDGATKVSVASRTLRVAMLALLLASPLTVGATARCAPPAKRACCEAGTRCCCGESGACSCRAGSKQSPTTPQPAAPQRQGDDERSAPALAALVTAQVDAPSLCSVGSPRSAATRPVAAAVLDTVVLRC